MAPEWSQTRLGVELISGLVSSLGVEYEANRAQFRYGRGRVRFRSGDKPSRLRGLGCDLLIIDESAFVDPTLWHTVRPSLADHRGRLLAIGTPCGSTWSVELETQPDCQLFHYGSIGNPYLAPSEIDAMRRDLPARLASQEIDAEIVDMSGSIFAPLCYCDSQDGPIPGHQYIAGVDIGGAGEDYTACAIYDLTAHIIPHYERFHGQSKDVVARLASTSRLWYTTAMNIEVNGVGQSVYDDLAALNVPVVPWTTTNATKGVLVNTWLSNPPNVVKDNILRLEFQNFTAKRLPSGLYTMGASSGHDDCVMAALIANWSATMGSVDYKAVLV